MIGPPISFVGSKQQDLKHIISQLPDMSEISTIVDAFGGGGSVTLRLAQMYPDKTVIYNDLDTEMIELFNILKSAEETTELLNWVGSQEYTAEEFKKRSKQYKDAGGNNLKERLFLTRIAYRGVHTATSPNMVKDKTTGKNVIALRSDYANFTKYTEALKNVEIRSMDARELIEEYKGRKDVFIYCDPPYKHTLTEIYACTDDDLTEDLKRAITDPTYACRLMLHLDYTHDVYYRMIKNVALKHDKRYTLCTQSNKKGVKRYLLIITNFNDA